MLKFELRSQKHLKHHERKSVGGTSEFSCIHGNCGKTFRRIAELIKHHNLHENNLDKCYFCPWGTPRGQTHNVETHLNQHLGEPNFKCSMCEKAFFRKFLLDYHFEVHHEKLEGKYSCQYCPFKTHSRNYLNEHTMIKHK